MKTLIVIILVIGVLAVTSSTPIKERPVTMSPPVCRKVNLLTVVVDYYTCVHQLVTSGPGTTIQQTVDELCENEEGFLECIWERYYEPGCHGIEQIMFDAVESLRVCRDNNEIQPVIDAYMERNVTLIGECIKKYDFSDIRDCLFPAKAFDPLTRDDPLPYKEGATYVQENFIDKIPVCFESLKTRGEMADCDGVTGEDIYLAMVAYISVGPLPSIDFSGLIEDVGDAGLLQP